MRFSATTGVPTSAACRVAVVIVPMHRSQRASRSRIAELPSI